MSNLKVNFGIRAHDVESNDIYTLFSKINNLGVRCTQLALTKSFPTLVKGKGEFNFGLANEIKKQLEQNQVRVAVLGCYINPVHPDLLVRREQLELFKEHIRFAKYIGADMIGTETGSFGTIEENHSEEVYQLLLESIREIVDYAGSLGVMIGIEPVSIFPICNPKVTKRFLDDLQSPNVSIILDPVNMIDTNNYQNHGQMIKECFELFGDKIAVIHLKDFIIDESGKKAGKYACDGILDVKVLFELLANKPYIDVILETVPETDWDRVRDNVTRIMSLV